MKAISAARRKATPIDARTIADCALQSLARLLCPAAALPTRRCCASQSGGDEAVRMKNKMPDC